MQESEASYSDVIKRVMPQEMCKFLSLIFTNNLLYDIFFFLVGLTWTTLQRDLIESQPVFDLNICKIDLLFTFDYEGRDCFPRTRSSSTSFADFAVFTHPNNTFQTEIVSMQFDSIDFNWYAGAQSQSNLEFGKALESRVERIYQNSWITKYFQFETKCENDVVFFYDKQRKNRVDSFRFNVYLYIPKLTRPYFYPLSEWKLLYNNKTNINLETSLISKVPHGFKTKSFPSSNSLFYTAPFFFIFKSTHALASNYLAFKSFFKPNAEDRVLSMVYFDENKNNFEIIFSPGITLPYTKAFPLNNVLEFTVYDSTKKQVMLLDYSQLYIIISVP